MGRRRATLPWLGAEPALPAIAAVGGGAIRGFAIENPTFRGGVAKGATADLNSIYFGHGCWGVVRASEAYFGKTPAQLDWAEASMLAGLPQAPSSYDPLLAFGRARARQRHVLDALVRSGVLTPQAAAAADAEMTSLRK